MTVSAVSNPTKLMEKYDVIAAWACIVMFFLILITFSALETYVHICTLFCMYNVYTCY